MSLIHIFRRQQQFSMIQQMDKFGESPERIQNTGAKADPPFAYGSAILALCRRKQAAARKKKRLRWIAAFVPSLILLLSPSVSTLFIEPDVLEQDISYMTDPYAQDSPAEQARYQIRHGNYDRAAQILDEAISEHPDGFALYSVYAELYDAQQDYNSEARILIHYLNDIFGTQNVTWSNICYNQLLDISQPLDSETQKLYDDCIDACEENIAQFQQLDSALEDGEYETVLDICNSMKARQTAELFLVDYYFSAYNGLGEYELCASYLLSLSEAEDSLDDFTDVFTLRSSMIKGYMQKIYPLVSTETQEKLNNSYVFQQGS